MTFEPSLWGLRTAAKSGGRFVHLFLPDDPQEALYAIAGASAGHRTAAAPSGSDEYDHGRLHDLVAQGGFSSHPARGDAPSSGFMASYHAPEGSGLATVHDLKDIQPEHIAAHRQAAAEHLAKPDSYQGGWLDRAENKVYLDASRHFKDEGDVRKFAVDQKQKAYFDLHDFSEKYLHPKLDPDAMKDHGAWQQKYSHLPEHERENPPEGYHSFAHLYPATDEQKSHWAAKGEKLAALRPEGDAMRRTAAGPEPLPQSPDFFYRFHHKDAPFGPEHAQSYSLTGGDEPQRGFSTFRSPHDLHHYLHAMDWVDAPEEVDFHDRHVIGFHGHQVGHGIDHEPLAVPHENHPDLKISWNEFQNRLPHTPGHAEWGMGQAKRGARNPMAGRPVGPFRDGKWVLDTLRQRHGL